MKEEKELLDKYGKKNPFTVPEGYFDRFIEELTEQLPIRKETETPPVSLWERVKPWVYMAAMFAGLFFSIRTIMPDKTNLQPAEQETISDLPDEYIDPIVNQTMMDDYELYQYLTSAEPTIY